MKSSSIDAPVRSVPRRIVRSSQATPQTGVRELGAREVRPCKIGACQVSEPKIRARDPGADEPHAAQRPAYQLRFRQVCPGQVGVLHPCAAQIRALQVNVAEPGFDEVQAVRVEPDHAGPREIAARDRTAHARIVEARVREVELGKPRQVANSAQVEARGDLTARRKAREDLAQLIA